jgi:hypothetical protein
LLSLRKEKLSFEAKITRFVGLIGGMRMLYELYLVLFTNRDVFFLLSDGILLFAFLLVVILTFYSIPIRWITIPFSIFVIVLLSYGWINTGGLLGVSEYNYIALIAIISLVHSGRVMFYFIVGLILIEMMLLWLWNFNYQFIESLIENEYSNDSVQYSAIVIAFTLCFLYLMYQYDLNRKKLEERKAELQLAIKEVKDENQLIEKRKAEIRIINEDLEDKIISRKRQLDERNIKLKSFLRLNVDEFDPPFKKMLVKLMKVKSDNNKSEAVQLLLKSSNALEKVYGTIAKEVKGSLE